MISLPPAANRGKTDHGGGSGSRSRQHTNLRSDLLTINRVNSFAREASCVLTSQPTIRISDVRTSLRSDQLELGRPPLSGPRARAAQSYPYAALKALLAEPNTTHREATSVRIINVAGRIKLCRWIRTTVLDVLRDGRGRR